MNTTEIDEIRGFIRGEEQSDKDVEMEVTMSNDKKYHIDVYSTSCFAEEGDNVFLVIYGENLKYLSQEHILAVEVISKEKDRE